MRNRFPGTCYRCDKWCAAGDGHFERIGSRFRVQHAECAIRFRGVPDPEREARQNARDQFKAKQTGKAAQNARRRLRDAAGIPPAKPGSSAVPAEKGGQADG